MRHRPRPISARRGSATHDLCNACDDLRSVGR
jgi:hypothetical protein